MLLRKGIIIHRCTSVINTCILIFLLYGFSIFLFSCNNSSVNKDKTMSYIINESEMIEILENDKEAKEWRNLKKEINSMKYTRNSMLSCLKKLRDSYIEKYNNENSDIIKVALYDNNIEYLNILIESLENYSEKDADSENSEILLTEFKSVLTSTNISAIYLYPIYTDNYAFDKPYSQNFDELVSNIDANFDVQWIDLSTTQYTYLCKTKLEPSENRD